MPLRCPSLLHLALLPLLLILRASAAELSRGTTTRLTGASTGALSATPGSGVPGRVDPLRTAWAGAGGNAYVIKFLRADPSVGQSRGVVAKAFQDKKARDEAYDELERIPPLRVLAGLAYPRDGMPANTFEGNCVHVRKDQDCCQTWKPTDTCYFLALDSAGERTMEQCLEEGTQGPGEKAVKYQVIGALKALQQIHEQGWSHNDFQLKNIMMNDMCQSSSVRTVDLDGMSRKHGPRGIRMLRDVAMFMGVCDQGAFPLPQMVAEVDRKGQGMANRIYEIARDVMDPHCGQMGVAQCVGEASAAGDEEACQRALAAAKSAVHDLLNRISALKFGK